ncbi:MAG: AzlD domain-containing protein [Fibrobacter sp.]|nr:AzlD domain-containing protein [Fibrobacter sp.]MCQ2120314.1 AzlD domain-containing protein [Fibrobacter sp.]
MNLRDYFCFLLVMTGVTYVLRAVPFVLMKKQLQSPFLKSFLAYIPYTVLAAMTVPSIFYATESRLSGILALVTTVIAACFGGGLVIAAIVSCCTVLCIDGFIPMLF